MEIAKVWLVELAKALIVLGVVWILAVAFSPLVNINVPAPTSALEARTRWVASVAAIIVSARVLFVAAAWVRKRA